MVAPILEVDSLCKSFGGVHALRDLSFELHAGEILGLIGPNGSGKSTTVNVLAGLHSATSGHIRLGGRSLGKLTEYQRVAAGLARTFQTASTFGAFTVREQVTLGATVTLKSNPIRSVFSFGGADPEGAAVAERVGEILKLTALDAVADREVSTISAAQQRFLMIATALASEPKVLLLDEPAAGLVVSERAVLADLIRAVRSSGVAVLVIEHHMGLIMEVCDRIVVLNFGSKIAEGSPEEIRNNQTVIDAYLGEAA
mgnify:CR=1 FL=1